MGGKSPKRRQLSLCSVFAGSPNFPIWELTSSGSDCHPHSTDGGHTASSTVSTHAFPLPQSQHWLLQPYRRRFNHHQTPPSTRASASLVLCTTLDRSAKRHTDLGGEEGGLGKRRRRHGDHLLNTNLILFSQT